MPRSQICFLVGGCCSTLSAVPTSVQQQAADGEEQVEGHEEEQVSADDGQNDRPKEEQGRGVESVRRNFMVAETEEGGGLS